MAGMERGHGRENGMQGGQPSSQRHAPPPPRAPAPSRDHNTTCVDIPENIYDKGGRTYTRGRLLGKGGFARCYEVTDQASKEISACKIVNKALLQKPHQREKMAQEIKIHRDLKHDYVVNFQSYFEDDANVYITLELCSKKSLMELQKRRRIITEPEARYFMRQIVLAVSYLHDEKHIIHRDLKLGNIFITENMHLKIGDFGLATKIEYDGERKKTLCGTPNYIAPEVLGKKGHSYEVDIWSIGCILYTLLVGRPPFETATLRDTYHKIKRGEYFVPQSIKIGHSARTLLAKLLQVNPALRPTAKQIMCSDFMTQGPIPASLPPSILSMAPRFDKQTYKTLAPTQGPNKEPLGIFKKPLSESNHPRGVASIGTAPRISRIPLNTSSEIPEGAGELTNTDILELMKSLREQIKTVVSKKPPASVDDDDESEDPNCSPELWICKWVDYSDKYGFGYQLSDDSIGVSFNDQTKVILLADGRSMHYIDKNGKEQYHALDNYPLELQKKVKLLNYFQQYMKENLLKASGGRNPPTPDCIARLPNMWTWFRTSRAVVMVLTNGTLQINNFRDHSKMIMCPLLGAISSLGSNKHMRTFKLASMDKGLSAEMLERLNYALEKVEVIIGNPKNQPRPTMISSPMKRLPV